MTFKSFDMLAALSSHTHEQAEVLMIFKQVIFYLKLTCSPKVSKLLSESNSENSFCPHGFVAKAPLN